MDQDHKITLYIAVSFFTLALFVSLIGVSASPLQHYFTEGKTVNQQLISLGFLFTTAAIAFLLSKPKKNLLLAMIFTGFASSGLHFTLSPWGGETRLESYFIACMPLFYFGLSSFLIMSYNGLYANQKTYRRINSKILLAFIIIFIFSSSGSILLTASSVLTPTIYDYELLKIEASLGLQPSYFIGNVVNQSDIIKNLLTLSYIALPFGFIALYSYSVSNNKTLSVNIIKSMLLSSAAAYIAYNFLPVVGPKYAFGDTFPLNMPVVESLQQGLPVLQSAAFRNGMPSMHVGWAILLWLITKQLRQPLIEKFFAVFLTLTIFATLGLGEHFLTDLVVAAPFIIACFAMATDVLPWSNQQKQNTIYYGFGMWLVWILLIRYTPTLLQIPGTLIIFYITTVWASTRLYKSLMNEVSLVENSTDHEKIIPTGTKLPGSSSRYLITLFALSGFAALTYEVVISKQLTYIFGSMATATYTVLITYMSGLAIGSWFGGKFAAKIKSPLLVYAILELCIGIFFLASPLIFDFIRDIYIQLGKGSNPASSLLLTLRISLGAFILFIPTFLMGITFPVLIKHYNTHNHRLGFSLSRLYSANTLGAALGSLVTGYLILPFLGVSKTLLLAVVINLIVAVLAIQLFKKKQTAEISTNDQTNDIVEAEPYNRTTTSTTSQILFSGLALLIIGIVSFGLETSYIQLLSVVAGNSAYAFSLMLFAFLLGIGLGAQITRQLLNRITNRTNTIGILVLVLACIALISLLYWDTIPLKFSVYQYSNLPLGFGQREFIRAYYCLIAMLPPALVIGALFPIASEVFSDARKSQLKWVGISSAINTTGNILGVLVTGFYLIPTYGTNTTVKIFAAICILLVITGIIIRAIKITPAIMTFGIASLSLLTFIPKSFDYDRLASGANVYFNSGHSQNVIAHAESMDGGLTTVSSKEINGRIIKTLLTNGKFQGNNAMDGEMIAQYGFSMAPLLHLSNKKNALIIGFGTGVSAKTLYDANFESIDIAELSKDIIKYAGEYFNNVNDLVMDKPNVQIHFTDGRNMLLLSEKSYDFIGLEITSIWFSGAASLYNQEFYQLAKNHLNKNGVLQQWVQLHHINPEDILHIIGTVRREFSHVWLYVIGGQGVIIASNSDHADPSIERHQGINSNSNLSQQLLSFGGNAVGISQNLLLNPSDIDRYLASFGENPEVWVSTDDNLFLEYSTPKGNALNGEKSMEINMAILTSYSSSFKERAVATID